VCSGDDLCKLFFCLGRRIISELSDNEITAIQSLQCFRTGFWPIEGLRGKNEKTGETIYFSLETPFVSWIARSATQLPGDYVVFQLGDDQICLFETATKKIALLARGQGPVVVLPKEN
jgi:hypothetical protein